MPGWQWWEEKPLLLPGVAGWGAAGHIHSSRWQRHSRLPLTVRKHREELQHGRKNIAERRRERPRLPHSHSPRAVPSVADPSPALTSSRPITNRWIIFPHHHQHHPSLLLTLPGLTPSTLLGRQGNPALILILQGIGTQRSFSGPQNPSPGSSPWLKESAFILTTGLSDNTFCLGESG